VPWDWGLWIGGVGIFPASIAIPVKRMRGEGKVAPLEPPLLLSVSKERAREREKTIDEI